MSNGSDARTVHHRRMGFSGIDAKDATSCLHPEAGNGRAGGIDLTTIRYKRIDEISRGWMWNGMYKFVVAVLVAKGTRSIYIKWKCIFDIF